MVRRQAPRVRCAFCAKSQEQVGKIIAASSSGTAVCALCHGRTALRLLVEIPKRGFLCFACLDAVRAASESESSNGQ
jgi:cytochrome c553